MNHFRGNTENVRYYCPVDRLVIADAHLGQAEGDVEAMCRLLRRVSGAGFAEVIYLGDAFRYLLGLEKFWSPTVTAVLSCWDDLRAAGMRIVLIEGNRDFFLDEPDLRARVDWVGKQYELTEGGRRIRLVHGDRVNLRDVQYRLWSGVSKSAPARVLARLLPKSLAVAIVERGEARLARTNLRFKGRTPYASLQRSAAQAWAEGVDVILWGHFHTSWSCQHGESYAAVVPDWLVTRCSVAIRANGALQLLDETLTPRERLPTMIPTDLAGS